MKKRVLFYAFAVLATFSLQSCVSNYVVSKPIIYKTDAKQASVNLNDDFSDIKNELTIDKKKIVKTIVVKAEEKERMLAIEAEIKKTQTIDGILSEASTYLGTPYRMGGTTKRGIDCSAFVLNVYGNSVGIGLPRVAAAQAQEGERIEKENLEKGDLVFFQTRGNRISHVGIVQDITPEGEIKFIHASSSKGVTISSLNEKYWGARYRFAKRVLNTNSLSN
ncbi:MAG: C40 family peptidase [Cloacibacterium sp.]|nr:C40 family peptidase [Cloacibacterium sp.]